MHLRSESNLALNPALALFSSPIRAWFTEAFPRGPTRAQIHAWPAITAGQHVLLSAPTGTGKTLAAFLAILDRLFRARASGALTPGVKCVYVSPLRSLSYDIERNLSVPLEGIRRRLDHDSSPIQVGVRTGDTSASERRKLRDCPPHILITTPESLSLLLSQSTWAGHWQGVQTIVVDEIHALAPSKRGADLAVSVERLAAHSNCDPIRVGLSATCGAGDAAAAFLVGPSRKCRVVNVPPSPGRSRLQIEVESLIEPGESPHGGLCYRRLLRHLRQAIRRHRTTVIFANTRAFAERLTHDLRRESADRLGPELSVAAHHSALAAGRRRAIESALRTGELRAVITSTSLELGVDIGTADLVIQIGLPGGVARCIQRIGRAGHHPGARSRGVLLAAAPAELIGAVITAQAARAGRVEPLRVVRAPLDVVCQQLVAMACEREQTVDAAFDLLRNTGPMATLCRSDFDDCLAFLAGELPAPIGSFGPVPGARPTWTSPRIWRRSARFGLSSQRVARWFRSNVGTINSEETVQVMAGGMAVGTLESAYAERLVPGDRFVLDGRALEVARLVKSAVITRPCSREAVLPRWTSERQSLSFELATELAAFRAEAARCLVEQSPAVLRCWLIETFGLDDASASVVIELFEAQAQWSEFPTSSGLLVEASPSPEGEGIVYSFHAPLHRAACEALARATAARLGRCFGRNLSLRVADLGWSLRLPVNAAPALAPGLIAPLIQLEGFIDDVLEGLDRGELLARRFQHVAATALMVLRNPEPGRRVRVGGTSWISSRLYPLVKAACPDHPVLGATRREVLEDVLDVPAAIRWLEAHPPVRCRSLPGLSPFAAAWIEPGPTDALCFEPPAAALRRLHARLALSR
jgi:ATP-dependent Lhr-like helicase